MMTPEEVVRTEKQEKLTVAHHDYERGLNVHAFFRVHNHAIGEDLVQDTFIKTWAYIVKGGKIDLMKAFLYHVLNNLIVDEYRKRKTISLDVLLEKGFEPSFENAETLFKRLDTKEALLLIRRLPKTYQRVMHMRYVRSFSVKETALITGQSTNSIAVQTHRGLIKLKKLFNPS